MATFYQTGQKVGIQLQDKGLADAYGKQSSDLKKAAEENESLRLECFTRKCNQAALKEQITQLIDKVATSERNHGIARDWMLEWKRRAKLMVDLMDKRYRFKTPLYMYDDFLKHNPEAAKWFEE